MVTRSLMPETKSGAGIPVLSGVSELWPGFAEDETLNGAVPANNLAASKISHAAKATSANFVARRCAPRLAREADEGKRTLQRQNVVVVVEFDRSRLSPPCRIGARNGYG